MFCQCSHTDVSWVCVCVFECVTLFMYISSVLILRIVCSSIEYKRKKKTINLLFLAAADAVIHSIHRLIRLFYSSFSQFPPHLVLVPDDGGDIDIFAWKFSHPQSVTFGSGFVALEITIGRCHIDSCRISVHILQQKSLGQGTFYIVARILWPVDMLDSDRHRLWGRSR